ncbi:alpha-L-fucosidase [Arthrobacter sp. 35W]|uniref:alpha-L-fucosidase n=1 Tax=Arthrobacter sp. 35W TaxID=1132441 RepID=UPI0003F9180A|nr:alpha-L-fucosidase [Arthrobacter sp. 35W]
MATHTLAYGANPGGRRTDAAMERFRGHRFGQFIHWGLYSIPAGRWNGEDVDFAAEFLPRVAKVPAPEWEALAGEFTLEAFNPEEWADTAAALGVRYMTITTKHHDGFCLWPTAQTDFHIGNTPSGRDVLAELIAAYEARGIDVNFYYSVLDWHHPDWRFALETAGDETAFARYLDFAMAQLEELATRYPSVKAFWFDGTWDESVKRNGKWTWEVEQRLKELVPGVVVNSRLRADDLGARHVDSNGALMGDYESGYERRLPDPWDTSVAERDWEACMTIPQASWGYHRGDWAAATLKHPADLVEMLVHCTSLGGNFLLNFGPRGDGSLQPVEVGIARAVGAWLAENGEAVYGCGHAEGWTYPGWGYYTAAADGTVYAVVTRRPASGRITLALPPGMSLAGHRALGPTSAGCAARTLSESTVEFDLSGCGAGVLAFALDPVLATGPAALREPNPDVLV